MYKFQVFSTLKLYTNMPKSLVTQSHVCILFEAWHNDTIWD